MVPSSPIDVALTLPVEGAPIVYKLGDGAKVRATDYVRTPETSRVRAARAGAGGPMLVDFNEGAAEVFAERSDVSAERQLSVDEVIARHQQQQRAQDALVRQLHRHGADGAALPSDDDRSRLRRRHARTATTSPTTGSSGRSCRSR